MKKRWICFVLMGTFTGLLAACAGAPTAARQEPAPPPDAGMKNRDVTVTVASQAQPPGLVFAVSPWQFDIRDQQKRTWTLVVDPSLSGSTVTFAVVDKPGQDCQLPPELPAEPHANIRSRGNFAYKPMSHSGNKPVECQYNIEITIDGSLYVLDPDYRIWP